MKCFYHPAYDAVGICKNCGKGLCSGCAVDMGEGLACKDQCEEAVEGLIVMVRRGRTAYEKTDKQSKYSAVIFLLMGLVFVGFGLYAEMMFAWMTGLLLCGFSLVRAFIKYAD